MSDASFVANAPGFLFTVVGAALLVAGGVWIACLAAYAVLTVANAVRPER